MGDVAGRRREALQRSIPLGRHVDLAQAGHRALECMRSPATPPDAPPPGRAVRLPFDRRAAVGIDRARGWADGSTPSRADVGRAIERFGPFPGSARRPVPRSGTGNSPGSCPASGTMVTRLGGRLRRRRPWRVASGPTTAATLGSHGWSGMMMRSRWPVRPSGRSRRPDGLREDERLGNDHVVIGSPHTPPQGVGRGATGAASGPTESGDHAADRSSCDGLLERRRLPAEMCSNGCAGGQVPGRAGMVDGSSPSGSRQFAAWVKEDCYAQLGRWRSPATRSRLSPDPMSVGNPNSRQRR
jgi:hypothetical protein